MIGVDDSFKETNDQKESADENPEMAPKTEVDNWTVQGGHCRGLNR